MHPLFQFDTDARTKIKDTAVTFTSPVTVINIICFNQYLYLLWDPLQVAYRIFCNEGYEVLPWHFKYLHGISGRNGTITVYTSLQDMSYLYTRVEKYIQVCINMIMGWLIGEGMIVWALRGIF